MAISMEASVRGCRTESTWVLDFQRTMLAWVHSQISSICDRYYLTSCLSICCFELSLSSGQISDLLILVYLSDHGFSLDNNPKFTGGFQKAARDYVKRLPLWHL